jgi:hypothetical protein
MVLLFKNLVLFERSFLKEPKLKRTTFMQLAVLLLLVPTQASEDDSWSVFITRYQNTFSGNVFPITNNMQWIS